MEEKKEKVGFFKRLGIGIASPKQYSRLANQSVLNTVGTFFIVSLIQVIVVMLLVVMLVNAAVKIADEYIPQIPEFAISNGELTLQDNTPIMLKEADTLFIVDSNILLDQVQDTYSNDVFSVTQYIAIAKDGFALKQGETLDRYQFSEFIKEDYTRSDLMEFYESYVKGFFKDVFLVTMFIFLFLLIFIGKIFGGIMFSIFGFIVSKIQDKNVSFKQLFNISMYAGMLPTLMFLLGGFMFVIIPTWIGIKYVIISIYIIIAIKHLPEDENKNDNVTFEIKE